MSHYKVFAVSVLGENHIKIGKVCQDYSLAVNGTNDYYETCVGNQATWERKKQPLFKARRKRRGRRWTRKCKEQPFKAIPVGRIAIVADGHGGDDFFRSDKGSQFAAESARECISDFLREKRKKDSLPSKEEINQIVRSIIKTWNEKVRSDFESSPFESFEMHDLSEQSKQRYISNEEDYRHAYGTTLIVAVTCEKYWFGIHIGDGRFTVLNTDGTFLWPVPWDNKCFLNATTSICDDDAFDRTRKALPLDGDPKNENSRNTDTTVSFVSKDIPAAIFLCSDGIDDSYPVNDNEEYLTRFYRTISVDFSEKDFDDVFNDIKNTLPKLSRKGSGDDMSLAGIINLDLLKKLQPFFTEQIMKEKLDTEQTVEERKSALEKRLLR